MSGGDRPARPCRRRGTPTPSAPGSCCGAGSQCLTASSIETSRRPATRWAITRSTNGTPSRWRAPVRSVRCGSLRRRDRHDGHLPGLYPPLFLNPPSPAETRLGGSHPVPRGCDPEAVSSCAGAARSADGASRPLRGDPGQLPVGVRRAHLDRMDDALGVELWIVRPMNARATNAAPEAKPSQVTTAPLNTRLATIVHAPRIATRPSRPRCTLPRPLSATVVLSATARMRPRTSAT